jgi:hypothetical protein
MSNIIQFPPTEPPPTEEERWDSVAFICVSIGKPKLELGLLKKLHDQWFRDVPDEMPSDPCHGDLEHAKCAVKILLWTLIQNREGAKPPPEFRQALLDFFGPSTKGPSS